MCFSVTDADGVTFLDDGDVETARDVPINLGRFPFDCVGSLRECPSAFTLRFKLHTVPGDPGLPYHYLLSTGGQTPLSEGWYFRQNYGKDYEAGVAFGQRLWTVSISLAVDRALWVAMMWSDQGLDVYVDGLPAGSDDQGKARLYVESGSIDPFPDVVVGRANHELWVDQLQTPEVKLADVTHWSQLLAVDDAFQANGGLGCQQLE